MIFFSMATSFSAAALGAEGLAADVTMLVGNGYTPGHAGAPWTCSGPSPACAACSSSGWPVSAHQPAECPVTARRPSRLELDPAVVRGRARWPARRARPVVKLARSHTTVSVERAVLRLAGLERRRPRGHPVGQPARRRRPRRRRARARVALPVWDALAPRATAARPAGARPEGGRRVGALPAAGGPRRRRAPAAPPRTAGGRAASRRIDRSRRERERLVKRLGDPPRSRGSTSSSRPATSTRTSRRRRPPPARAPTSSR